MKRPEKTTLIAPPGGWKTSTWYVAEVSYSNGNPVHLTLFYSGFLHHDKNEVTPGSYNSIVPIHGTADHRHTTWRDVEYLKGLFPLCDDTGAIALDVSVSVGGVGTFRLTNKEAKIKKDKR